PAPPCGSLGAARGPPIRRRSRPARRAAEARPSPRQSRSSGPGTKGPVPGRSSHRFEGRARAPGSLFVWLAAFRSSFRELNDLSAPKSAQLRPPPVGARTTERRWCHAVQPLGYPSEDVSKEVNQISVSTSGAQPFLHITAETAVRPVAIPRLRTWLLDLNC